MFSACFRRVIMALSQMLEVCDVMEIQQHPTSINADIFSAATVDDYILKAEDNSEISVNNDLDDLGFIFGDPLVMCPPNLEEVFQQNNEVEDLFEEDNDDDGINLMG